MDDEVIIEKLLNGVPMNDFITFYIVATAAMLIVMGINVSTNVKKTGWNWPKFWHGWKRFSINLLLIAAGIVFWPNISSFMLESDTQVDLTLWSAFGLGLALDRLRSWVKSKTTKK